MLLSMAKPLWAVMALLPVIEASQCIAGASFEGGGKTSCMCDRFNRSDDSPAPSCLLNSDETRVAPFFLEPDAPLPLPFKLMEDFRFWEAQDVKAAKGGCPAGFERPGDAGADPSSPGFYRYNATWLPQPLQHWLGCAQVRRCPQGYYCEEGDTAPMACGKGSLCNETGLTSPRPCPEGFYCPTSLMVLECFRGSFCPKGSLVPASCRKGFYCPSPCEQIKCPEDHWCPEASFEPRPCSWWNRCRAGASSVDWYTLGLSIACTIPILFELILRLTFRRPVHEQTAFKSLQGMTAPCLVLLCITLLLAWLLMPAVALAKSSVLLYTIASVATPHRLRMWRFVLVGLGALMVFILEGIVAASWIIYVPICLFAGFLFSAPSLAYQRRGFNAVCCLVVSLFFANCFLFMSGVSFTAEEEKGVTIAQGCLALGHLWLFLLALMFLFYTEVARQQNLQAHEASLIEMAPGAGQPASVAQRKGIAFRLEDVGLTVRSSDKPVLKNISLEISADSSCALMGPSGSGKSSLLNVLTGRALHYGDVCGQMFANNESIPEGIESNLKTKNASGFVPQDDVMHTELTVYENVYFSARLRLAPNTGLLETATRVETVLKDVGIWHVKDSVVGNAEVRGISGGQRKRTSIAMELVGEPSVLFLDEPTSGLDAAAAHSIVKLLCKSQLHCTTVAVIHQPRWQTLECFDQVVLLATGGFLVYSGPVRESVKYFSEVLEVEIPAMSNPADLFLDFIDSSTAEGPATTAEELAAQWVANKEPTTIGSSISDSFHSVGEREAPPLASYEKFRPGVSETFWTLYLRCCLQVVRLWKHRVTNLGLVALFLAVVRLLLGDEGDFEQTLVKLGIAQSMLMLPVCIHSMYVFSSDRLERQREDTAGIPTLSQYMAKDFCHFIEVLLFAVLWTGIYGPFSHVAATPWVLLRLAVAQCYLAFGISFFLSVNLPSQSTATVTIMLLLVVAQLCSGVDLIAFGDVHAALRGVGWVIFMLSPSFYTVERILPILLNDGCTEPVRRAVCDGVLQKKGVSCNPPSSPESSASIIGSLTGQPNFLFDMKNSYIFLATDIQLVMFAIALRAITLFQIELRAGRVNGDVRQRVLCRLAIGLLATFLIFTIPLTSNARMT